MTTTINGVDVSPQVGRFVQPDGWPLGAILAECDWGEAPFRLPSRTGRAPAVDIKVTGRTLRYDAPGIAGPAVRVRVTFVRDGETNETTGGWMVLNTRRF